MAQQQDRVRWFGVLASLLVAGGFAAASFFVVREFASDEPAQADPSAQPTSRAGDVPTSAPGVEEPPGPDVTPEPGATPDTSKPYWTAPYQNAERLAPRFDQLMAGILFGPGVEREPVGCAGETSQGGFEAAAGSPLEIAPSYLPDGAIRGLLRLGTGVVLCDGAPVGAAAEYSAQPAPDAFSQVTRGEKTWFEVQHGFSFHIIRWQGEAAHESHVPSERFQEVEFADGFAAVAGPPIQEGWGQSAVYFYRDGVMTVVEAWDLPLEETLKIAEGLFE